jgi:diacylglycerol kinase family enzyme
MHFATVLNRDGGTLRTTDLDAFSGRIRQTLEAAGHSCDIAVVDGAGVEEALTMAASSEGVEVVMAGGGDGTMSAAAGILRDSGKALAIIPAGTMNLFARGLGIPLGLDEAVTAFATGEIRAVDTATANGRPFIHQLSIGMHAKMVKLREQMEFGSRWSKLGASVRASYHTILNPPVMKVALEMEETEIVARTTGIGFTNNLFGEGHLPYSDKPDAGVLGIYITVARHRGEIVRHFVNVARGRWRDNDQVEIHEAKKVVLKLVGRRSRRDAVLDGELIRLEDETEIAIAPRSLRVLVPAKKAETSWLDPLAKLASGSRPEAQ